MKREKRERRCSEGVRVRAVESRRRGGQLSAFPVKITSRIASESSVEAVRQVSAYPVRDEVQEGSAKGTRRRDGGERKEDGPSWRWMSQAQTPRGGGGGGVRRWSLADMLEEDNEGDALNLRQLEEQRVVSAPAPRNLSFDILSLASTCGSAYHPQRPLSTLSSTIPCPRHDTLFRVLLGAS